MVVIDSTLKILWLSDIHYIREYSDDNKNMVLKNYISSFVDYCKKIKNVDYILLSGDITNSGLKEEYYLFFKDILKPLLDLPNFKRTELLVIPGNHDVNRNSKVFFKDYINKISEKEFNRSTFLKDNINAFKCSFQEYSSSFKEFKNRLPISISSSYKEDFYNGFIINDKKKVIFVLLNSAWYSFGDKFLDKYFDMFLTFENSTIKTKKKREELIKDLGKLSEEYGNQIVNLDVFNGYNKLFNKVIEYNDYVIITCMHHPLNWLGWDERINNSNNVKDKFLFLKNQTDILLTGHEHVPKEHNSDYLNNKNILHLPAGCFMEKQDPSKFEIKNNWFSVLKINTRKRTVIQDKIAFNINKGKWIPSSHDPKELNKSYDLKLNQIRKEKLLDKIEDLYKSEGILRMISKYKILKLDNDIYQCSKTDQLIIPVKNTSFFVDGEILKKVIKMTKNVDIVSFIFVDLLGDENNTYCASNDRLKTISEIKQKADYLFDNFRHSFFSSLGEDDVRIFSNLKFVLKIIPFWEIESYLHQ